MSWDTAVSDIRMLLSDGPTDKLMWRKQVLGQLDGTNTKFKTFEFRRVTDFTVAPTDATGVFVDDALQTVTADDLVSGGFTLSAAPTNGQTITATYYVQWFTDAELTQFVTSAAEWSGYVDSFTSVPEGLRPASKEYAASQAFQKLSLRFAMNLAETYQLYDAPDQKRFDPVKAYADIAKQKMDLAFRLRDDFYKNRQGQALAPRSGVVRGRVRDVAPKR